MHNTGHHLWFISPSTFLPVHLSLLAARQSGLLLLLLPPVCTLHVIPFALLFWCVHRPSHGMFCITASNPSPPWQYVYVTKSINSTHIMTSIWWQPLGGSLLVFPYLMQHPQAQTGLINGSKALQRCSFDLHFCHTPLYGMDRNSYTVYRCWEQLQNGWMLQND